MAMRWCIVRKNKGDERRRVSGHIMMTYSRRVGGRCSYSANWNLHKLVDTLNGGTHPFIRKNNKHTYVLEHKEVLYQRL